MNWPRSRRNCTDWRGARSSSSRRASRQCGKQFVGLHWKAAPFLSSESLIDFPLLGRESRLASEGISIRGYEGRTPHQSLGISDVRLGKVCRKLKIPRPGRGYWAKRAVGRPVEQMPLAELKDVPVVRRLEPTAVNRNEFLTQRSFRGNLFLNFR